jgi:YidC/Oxa1 family membrane protein insertase
MDFIVQPIFNVLTLIYALLPGHNFGFAVILFTLVARFALYPMLKKQLRHTKAMRELQPEIKKIKDANKGNKQQESVLTMELYKEREIKPIAYIGLMVVQLVIFLALFSGLNRIVGDPSAVYDFSYEPIQNLSSMQELKEDPGVFDNTLFGVVDLSRPAVDLNGEGGVSSSFNTFYFPAFLLVLGSSLIQFFQIRQTMPKAKDSRKLRDILQDANSGKQADSAEMNAAMGRNLAFILPIVIFVVTIGFAAALALYWFVGGLIAYLQQRHLLKQDEYMMLEPTAEVVAKKPLKTTSGTSVKKEAIKPVGKSKKDRKNAPVVVTRLSEETNATPKVVGRSATKKAQKKRKKKR